MGMRTRWIALSAIASCMAAAPAAAESFNFNYSYTTVGQTYTVNARLTGVDQGDGSFLITGASGTRLVSGNTAANITGIAALGSINGNDNLLFTPSTSSISAFFSPVDAAGIAFIEDKGASPIDVFQGRALNGTSLAQETFLRAGTSVTQPASGFLITVTPVAAAVPESASWAMMILGMGAVGFSMRAAKRRSDRKFDARIKRIADGAAA